MSFTDFTRLARVKDEASGIVYGKLVPKYFYMDNYIFTDRYGVHQYFDLSKASSLTSIDEEYNRLRGLMGKHTHKSYLAPLLVFASLSRQDAIVARLRLKAFATWIAFFVRTAAKDWHTTALQAEKNPYMYTTDQDMVWQFHMQNQIASSLNQLFGDIYTGDRPSMKVINEICWYLKLPMNDIHQDIYRSSYSKRNKKASEVFEEEGISTILTAGSESIASGSKDEAGPSNLDSPTDTPPDHSESLKSESSPSVDMTDFDTVRLSLTELVNNNNNLNLKSNSWTSLHNSFTKILRKNKIDLTHVYKYLNHYWPLFVHRVQIDMTVILENLQSIQNVTDFTNNNQIYDHIFFPATQLLFAQHFQLPATFLFASLLRMDKIMRRLSNRSSKEIEGDPVLIWRSKIDAIFESVEEDTMQIRCTPTHLAERTAAVSEIQMLQMKFLAIMNIITVPVDHFNDKTNKYYCYPNATINLNFSTLSPTVIAQLLQAPNALPNIPNDFIDDLRFIQIYIRCPSVWNGDQNVAILEALDHTSSNVYLGQAFLYKLYQQAKKRDIFNHKEFHDWVVEESCGRDDDHLFICSESSQASIAAAETYIVSSFKSALNNINTRVANEALAEANEVARMNALKQRREQQTLLANTDPTSKAAQFRRLAQRYNDDPSNVHKIDHFADEKFEALLQRLLEEKEAIDQEKASKAAEVKEPKKKKMSEIEKQRARSQAGQAKSSKDET